MLPPRSSSASMDFSRINDPVLLSELCSPFADGPVDLDTFTFEYATDSLIPRARAMIHSGNFTPLQKLSGFVRLIIDNFETEGLSQIHEGLLRPLESLVRSRPYLNLYLDAVSSIPSRYRDDFLIIQTNEMSNSSNRELRVLAANLITLVRRNCQVASHFMSLAQDENPEVRLEVANLLKNSNFDTPVFESILSGLAADTSQEIRIATAFVYGDVAPCHYEPYLRLLIDPITMEAALQGFVPVAQYSGFAAVGAGFCSAVKVFPERCASALLDLVSVADPGDLELIFRGALLLRHCSTFVKNLFTFSQFFQSKRSFLSFFKVAKMKSEDERVTYAQQCALFVPVLGSELLGPALAFAHDESQDVRAAAGPILSAICRKEPSVIEQVRKLSSLDQIEELQPTLTNNLRFRDWVAGELRYPLNPIRIQPLSF